MKTALATSRPVAAAERKLARAAASVAVLARAMHTISRLQASLGPGSFLHDLVLLSNRKASQAKVMAAKRRLARLHVRPRTIFYGMRWTLIRDAFRAWRGERTFEEAWEDLVVASIFIESKSIPGDLLLCEVFPDLRRRLRSAIELELLGHTLDSKYRSAPLEDAEPLAVHDTTEVVEHQIDLRMILSHLDAQEQAFLRHYSQADSAGKRAMAGHLGISYDNMRSRQRRLLAKLKMIIPQRRHNTPS